ncbi:MAG: DUF2252 domain-containing protein [Actinobacteria bacterium]|nr:DUF2252 domain-containing protein [Actinomycetota bacterium]
MGSTARSSVEDRRDTGRDARGPRARTSVADWTAAAGRPDPVAVIEQPNSSRLAARVPQRRRRMLLSPFSFYRGGAAVMAAGLSVQLSAGLVVQLCGDAHLANFGLFGSPERELVFDLNDFDETHLGPFEWDVIRLAVSGALLGRNRDGRRRSRTIWCAPRSARTAMPSVSSLIGRTSRSGSPACVRRIWRDSP